MRNSLYRCQKTVPWQMSFSNNRLSVKHNIQKIKILLLTKPIECFRIKWDTLIGYIFNEFGGELTMLIWRNAKDSIDDEVYDITGEEIIWDPSKPHGRWDIGCVPCCEYRTLLEEMMNEKISPEEFIEIIMDSDTYRPELPHTNRCGRYESKIKVI